MGYTLITSSNSVIRNLDGAYIPEDQDNVDWLEYQQWLADGNTPDAPVQLDWKTPIMDDFRIKRDVYLARLAGIALFDGTADPTLRAAAATFRQRLLDIPNDPSVINATSVIALKGAILTLYKAAVIEAKTTAPLASSTFDKVSK